MTSDKYFETRFEYDESRDAVWKIITSYLAREIRETDAVLDLGAGYCSFINNVKARKKYAVDTYPDFAKNAAPGVETYVRDAWDLSVFVSGSLDVVFSSNILEHMTREQIIATLKEVQRVLKKGGKFILLLPNFKYAYKTYYDDYTHVTPLTEVGTCDLLRSEEFRIRKSFPKFLPFSFKSWLPKAPLLVWLYLRLPFKPFAGQMLIIAEKP